MNTTRFPGKVPQAVVRVTAVEVSIIAILTIIFSSPWPALFLTLDMAARGFITPRYSLLATVSKSVWVPALRLGGPDIFYTPKKFAARIGFALSFLATIFLFLDLLIAGSTVIGILALFSFMEGAFNYCVGCKVFSVLAGRGYLDSSDCQDCVS